MSSTVDAIFEAAMALPIEQRAELSDRLLESMPPSQSSLSEELRTELDRRWAQHLANPDDVIAWEELKEDVLARIK
jgi:putative addiction module component (TIGR02574 family)